MNPTLLSINLAKNPVVLETAKELYSCLHGYKAWDKLNREQALKYLLMAKYVTENFIKKPCPTPEPLSHSQPGC